MCQGDTFVWTISIQVYKTDPDANEENLIALKVITERVLSWGANKDQLVAACTQQAVAVWSLRFKLPSSEQASLCRDIVTWASCLVHLPSHVTLLIAHLKDKTTCHCMENYRDIRYH